MDSVELNKIVAAVLVTLLVIQTARTIGDALVATPHVEEPAYTVAGPGEEAATETAAATAEEKPAAEEAGPEPIAPLLAAASVEDGEKVAKKCAACHSFDEGGPNKVGPNLYGIVGAEKGHLEGFGYSGALAGAEGTWTYEDLNAFLADPRGYLPGTRMTFAGVKKAEDRAAVIKYLRSLSDSPEPLPGG